MDALVATDANMDGAPVSADMAMDQGLDAGLDMEAILTPGIVVAPLTGLTTTEMGGTATFSVVLSSPPTDAVSIAISSSDTTEGTVAPAMLVFTSDNWNAPQDLLITGVDDAFADGPVDYTIVVAPATSTDPAYSGRDGDDVAVTNTDDETPGFTVTPTSGLFTTEAGGTATFSVVLNAAPDSDVAIALTSSNELEATVSPAALTFTSLNWNAPQIVTVTGVDDGATDGDQAFMILTGAAVSADSGYAALDPDDVSGTNRDDESAAIVVDAAGSLETTESGGTAMFTVVLASAPSTDVMISVASSDATEGECTTSSIVFTPSDWNVPHAIIVDGVDDVLIDGDQPYTILLGNAVSADPLYNGRAVSDVSLVNVDDDSARYIVTPTDGLVTTEGGGTATFTLVLTARPLANVIFSVTSTDSTEGTTGTVTRTFTTGNWNVPQIVTVTGVNDAIADGDQMYDVVVHVNLTADPNYMALADTHVQVVNMDDETPGITVNPTSGLMTTEAGGSAIFTIVLNSQPSAPVTINLASDTTTEGTVSPSSVMFTTSNWGSPRTITVTGVNDFYADGARAYNIVTSAAVSADGTYNGLNASDVAVVNLDNDTAGISVAPASILAPEGGPAGSFQVTLTSRPTANVTIPLRMLNTAQGTLSVAMLTFTTANWNVPQLVTATGIADGVPDGLFVNTAFTDPAISTDMTYSGMDGPDVTVTHTEGASISVTPTSGLVTSEAGGTATFTIVLNSAPGANVTIYVVSSSEGMASPSMVVFTPMNYSTPQTITVTGRDDFYDDGDKPYVITTSAAVSTDPGYNGLNPPDVSATNIDDDTAGLTMTPLAAPTTSENGDVLTFTLSFTALSTAALSFSFSLSDPSESAIVFPSGLGAHPQVVGTPLDLAIAIRGVDDLIVDGDVPFTINATITSSDASYNGLTVMSPVITNLDNDSNDILVSPVQSVIATEAGGTSTFAVVLTRAPSANVVVGLTSSDIGEATVSPAMLTFTPANWSTPQTAVVSGVADGTLDGDQTVAIITGPAMSTDGSYSGLNPVDVNVNVIDVDGEACASVSPFYRPVTGLFSGYQARSLSADGRFITFDSGASNVVPSDTNANIDVFVRDRQTHTVTRESVATGGGQASGYAGRISADGRYVVFLSASTALVASDTNGFVDAFVRDRMLGTTERVSVSDTGSQLAASTSSVEVSGDGRYVAFSTTAPAVASDTNGVDDIYIRDLMAGTTTRASLGTGGAQGTAASNQPSLSGDGRYMAFITASSLTSVDTNSSQDVYVRDLQTNTTTLVSISTSGTASTGGGLFPMITSDGRYVVFASPSTNLVVGDTNAKYDVFVRDLLTATTVRASVGTAGVQLAADSTWPSISNDGQRVAFVTSQGIVAADTNSISDVYVRDIAGGTIALASRSPTGQAQNFTFGAPFAQISADGETIAFMTFASNIVSPQFDFNGQQDVYVLPVP